MQIDTPTVLIVPGLRDESSDHWQTHLEIWLRGAGRKVKTVPPIGKSNYSCLERVDGISNAVRHIEGQVLLVAHSGGCLTVAHWALKSSDAWRVRSALLAVPPDFDTPLPDGYPSIETLKANAWLPIPRFRLPFASTVIASTNDPLAHLAAVKDLALRWGSALLNVGNVGHLNPASGFGPWPQGQTLVSKLLL